MYVQLNKRIGIFQLIAIILFCTPNTLAQIDILNEALKTVDILNETLLEITTLSDEEENAISEEIEELIAEENTFSKYDLKRTQRIFTNIHKYVKRTGLKYRFSILECEEVNAYAVAGGMTYFNTGLLKACKTDDELAYIVAHEIAHNELKHCIKQIQYAVIASGIDPILGNVVQQAYSIYQTPFSKDQEFEADSLGVVLMEKAGYKREGAISFLKLLKELEKQYGAENRDSFNDFISSHPTAQARIERIQNQK